MATQTSFLWWNLKTTPHSSDCLYLLVIYSQILPWEPLLPPACCFLRLEFVSHGRPEVVVDFMSITAQILTQPVLPWPLTIKAGWEQKKIRGKFLLVLVQTLQKPKTFCDRATDLEPSMSTTLYTEMNQACRTGILLHTQSQCTMHDEAIM